MNSKFLAALFFPAVMMIAAPASAGVTTLDFSDNICGPSGTSGCSNGSFIGQSYGDSAQVDVSYRAVNSGTGVTQSANLQYWNSNYGDLTGVVWGGTSGGTFSEITFTPAAGYEVSLLSFDFATFDNRFPTVPIRITSGRGATIYDSTDFTFWPVHNTLLLHSAFFADGITLQWGPNGYDVGLDNISFDVQAISGGGGVPEPATWAMMIAGFGMVGGAMRARGRARLMAVA